MDITSPCTKQNHANLFSHFCTQSMFIRKGNWYKRFTKEEWKSQKVSLKTSRTASTAQRDYTINIHYRLLGRNCNARRRTSRLSPVEKANHFYNTFFYSNRQTHGQINTRTIYIALLW